MELPVPHINMSRRECGLVQPRSQSSLFTRAFRNQTLQRLELAEWMFVWYFREKIKFSSYNQLTTLGCGTEWSWNIVPYVIKGWMLLFFLKKKEKLCLHFNDPLNNKCAQVSIEIFQRKKSLKKVEAIIVYIIQSTYSIFANQTNLANCPPHS